MSVKVCAPRWRFLTISGVHRSAKISAPLAIGQYWPYPRFMACELTAFFVVAPGSAPDHDRPVISVPPVERLRREFRGPIVTERDPGYEETRRIWNLAIERRPTLIARCTGAADVIAALRWAREEDLRIAVRGGGHNVAGTALCEGGIVIDLQLMRGIAVDPRART